MKKRHPQNPNRPRREMGESMTPSAISHQEEAITAVDWDRLAQCAPEDAVEAIRGILVSAEATLDEAETRLTAIRESIFNVRMCCFRIVSQRELWKLDTDPEYGLPYKTMTRWMAVLYPKDEGLRYAQEANATQKALPAVTIEDLAEMKRCNAVDLARASTSCQRDPAVIQAAKTATHKRFRRKLTVEHSQVLEDLESIGPFTYPAGQTAEVRRYLQWVAGKAELDPEDYQGALLYLAIHENQEHGA